MKIRGREMSFFLFVSKAVKVSRIEFGYFFPTLKAKIVLKLLNCSYGTKLKVSGKVYFRPDRKQSIILGNNVTITARFLTNNVGITNAAFFESAHGGKIIIGNNTGLTSTIISSRKSILIGNYVNIGGNVRIFDHDFHSLFYLDRRDRYTDVKNTKTSEIVIGDDVFIGTNAIILKGVHIGARSIIGAGSVVALKYIPPDSIVIGNPAKVISSRTQITC